MPITDNTHINEDSALVEEDACKLREISKQRARQIIIASLPKAAEKLSTLSEIPEEITDGASRAAIIRFKACAHLLKLGGLEQENVVHSGKVEFTPLIIESEGQ